MFLKKIRRSSKITKILLILTVLFTAGSEPGTFHVNAELNAKAPALPTEYTIDFDDIIPGTVYGEGGYYSLGSGRRIKIEGYSSGTPTIIESDSARSGSNVLKDTAVDEFLYNKGSIKITFENFYADYVSVYAGMEEDPFHGEDVFARIHAFWHPDAIPFDTSEINLGNSAIPCSRLLAVEGTDAFSIMAVEIEYYSHDYDTSALEIIDDLYISVTADEPEAPEDSSPPAVTITSPRDDPHTVTARWVMIAGIVEEDIGPVEIFIGDEKLSNSDFSRVSIDPPEYYFCYKYDLDAASDRYTIYVTAYDSAENRGRDSIEVNYEEPPAPPAEFPATLNFVSRGLEITQTVQDWEYAGAASPQDAYNPNKMITGKKTLVRVYAEALGTEIDIPGVDCYLHAYRTGTEIEGSPIRSMNLVTLSPGEDHIIQRTDQNKSFNFILPSDWTAPGSINLVAIVNEWQPIDETHYDVYNNAVEDVTFYNTEHPLSLRVYRVRSTNQGNVRPTWAECVSNITRLRQIYPVPPDNFNIRNCGTITTGRVLAMDDDGTDELERLLRSFRRLLGLYYNMPNTYGTGTVALALTHNTVTHRGMTAWERPVSISVASDGEFYRIKTAHEVGHAIGFGHVQGCDDPADPYESYPDYEDPYGVDYHEASIGCWAVQINDDNTIALKDPDIFRDFMSYCTDYRWMSPYSWTKICNILGATVTSKPLIIKAPASMEPYLIISGIIDPDPEGETGLDPVVETYQPAGSGFISDPKGAYSITLTGPNSIEEKYFFNPDKNWESASYETFSLMITPPEWKPIHSIILTRNIGSVVLDNITAGSGIPVVNIISPKTGEDWPATGTRYIAWNAYDTDQDLLTYTVLYSNDDGDTWTGLGSDIPQSQTSIETDLSELPGGEKSCRVRVIATDGINSGYGNSHVFTKEKQAPHVQILGPTPVTVFDKGETVMFEGLVWDADNTDIPKEKIRWVSDKDGTLGFGQVFGATNLSAGLHRISFEIIENLGYSPTLTYYDPDAVTILSSDITGVYIYDEAASSAEETEGPCGCGSPLNAGTGNTPVGFFNGLLNLFGLILFPMLLVIIRRLYTNRKTHN